jgi:hypothetical protein
VQVVASYIVVICNKFFFVQDGLHNIGYKISVVQIDEPAEIGKDPQINNIKFIIGAVFVDVLRQRARR